MGGEAVVRGVATAAKWVLVVRPDRTARVRCSIFERRGIVIRNNCGAKCQDASSVVQKRAATGVSMITSPESRIGMVYGK
jgi:hypothetical protein